jgi:hypothetical protein
MMQILMQLPHATALHATLTSVAALDGIISNDVPTATLLILGLIQTATEMDKE